MSVASLRRRSSSICLLLQSSSRLLWCGGVCAAASGGADLTDHENWAASEIDRVEVLWPRDTDFFLFVPRPPVALSSLFPTTAGWTRALTPNELPGISNVFASSGTAMPSLLCGLERELTRQTGFKFTKRPLRVAVARSNLELSSLERSTNKTRA